MTQKTNSNESQKQVVVPSTLHDKHGQRKYLTADERAAFIKAIEALPQQYRLYCATLLWTGCRPSEARLLHPHHLDISDGVIIIPTLKKRVTGVFRRVPVPGEFLLQLRIHTLNHKTEYDSFPLFPWGRTHAYNIVKSVLNDLGHSGTTAMPKTLRHTFGTHAISSGVPVHLVQRWMGHSDPNTTAIYLNVQGTEERAFAARMW